MNPATNVTTFQRIAALLAGTPVAIAGLGGAVLLVALQAWRKRGSDDELRAIDAERCDRPEATDSSVEAQRHRDHHAAALESGVR